MTVFDSVVDCESCLDVFDIGQGDRAAELAWTLTDGRPHEVRIYRSCRGFVGAVADGGDPGQLLVYEGTDPAARLGDASHGGDIVYRYAPEIAYYYSVFIRSGGGGWRLQLKVKAQPRSVGHWERSLETAC